MDTIAFHFKGAAPALMQAERLANPLDPLTKQLKAITSKKKKTDADHEEMARIEFIGSLYYDPKLGPYWPGQNIDRMFYDAAKLSRRGQDIKRAFMTLDDRVPLLYEGPRTPEALYADRERFVDIRSVVIQMKRTMRCRPIFRDWEVKFEVAFDPDVLNPADIMSFARTAGQMVGLSMFRPRYGRFTVLNGADRT
jgi:hypothetical protein